MNRANNINGIDGDPLGAGNGLATHTLRLPRVLALQERYVAKVIETVGDLDNVLYEISNESRARSAEWQYHMIRFINQLEDRAGKRHPAGMTSAYDNQDLFDSPADWVSPNGRVEAPPVADGHKVVLWDTDHVCGLCDDPTGAWRALARGANPVFMDPFDSTARSMDIHLDESYRAGAAGWVAVRRNVGDTRRFAMRLRLETMVPRPELASTGYCLADTTPGRAEYLAYAPDGGRLTVDLRGVADTLAVEWFSPSRGAMYAGASVPGGGRRTFAAPFRGQSVLHLRAGASAQLRRSP